jgi:hypothetical protein
LLSSTRAKIKNSFVNGLNFIANALSVSKQSRGEIS